MNLTKHYAPLMIPLSLHQELTQPEFHCYPAAEVDAALDRSAQECAQLRSERDQLQQEVAQLTHQVIACSVAARNPELYRKQGSPYSGRWQSKQSEEIYQECAGLREQVALLKRAAWRKEFIRVALASGAFHLTDAEALFEAGRDEWDYEIDPGDALREEMSYWDDDGDAT
jgi:hypothetical protein